MMGNVNYLDHTQFIM